MINRYVCGFMFSDDDLRHVLLIRKTKPEWQAGRYNGIGGKIEHAETPRQAMARELWEETGISMLPEQWATFHTEWLGTSAYVRFMVCVPQPLERLERAIAITEEVPRVWDSRYVEQCEGQRVFLPNVPYLVKMARTWLRTSPEHRPLNDGLDDHPFSHNPFAEQD